MLRIDTHILTMTPSRDG